jgi:hypothetical protein
MMIRGRYKLILCIIPAVVLLATIHPLLSSNDPLNTNILVVEGWLPDYALHEAVLVFRQGNYSQVFTTGASFGNEKEPDSCSSLAHCAAQKLVELGIEEEIVVAVPSPAAEKHRTDDAARALRQYLYERRSDINAVNVFTVGVHGRKTHLVYEKVLRPNIQVGILTVEPQTYDARFWWLSWEGIQWVTLDLAKYLRALLTGY